MITVAWAIGGSSVSETSMRTSMPGGVISAYAWDMETGGFPYAALVDEMAALGVDVPKAPNPHAARLDVLVELWTDASATEVATTVHPFILRGVSLLGIDSVQTPIEQRREAWKRLETDLDRQKLAAMTREIGLSGLTEAAAAIVAGKLRGRIVVKMR